jgi:hypothetical protein
MSRSLGSGRLLVRIGCGFRRSSSHLPDPPTLTDANRAKLDGGRLVAKGALRPGQKGDADAACDHLI